MAGNVKMYNIYFGKFSSTTMDLMDYFAANVGTSTWYSVLSTYSHVVNGVKTSIPPSGKAVFVDRWTYRPSSTKLTITDADIVNAISSNLNSPTHTMPFDDDGIYFVMFRGDFIYSGWNDPSSSYGYCGYHTVLSINDLRIKLAVVGDPSNAIPRNDGCIGYGFSPLANGDMGADSMVTTYAHELVETITDYDGNTWYRDSDGEENADICNFDFQTTGKS